MDLAGTAIGSVPATKTRLCPSNRMALGIVMAAAYLPCMLGFFMDQSGDVASWTVLWPFVPCGFYLMWTGRLLGIDSLPPVFAYALCLVATAGLIFGLWRLGRRGFGWLAISALLGAVLSMVAVVAAISAVRM